MSMVPAAVAKFRVRIAMSRAGISEAAVETVLNGMSNGQAKTEALIWWKQANDLERNHPVVAHLGVALGLTAAQIDALFVAAAAL